MCEYCDMTLVNKKHAADYYIHKPLHLRNDDGNKRIKADGNHPVMYLREWYKPRTHLWQLVCEFADGGRNLCDDTNHLLSKMWRKIG